jgi:hypothetical protein
MFRAIYPTPGRGVNARLTRGRLIGYIPLRTFP